jgi:hypothetical protein
MCRPPPLFFQPRPKISGAEPKINLLSFQRGIIAASSAWVCVRGSDANYSIFHLAQSGSNLSEGRSCERIYFILARREKCATCLRRTGLFGPVSLHSLFLSFALFPSVPEQRQHLSGAFPAFNSVPDRCEYTAGCNLICLWEHQETHRTWH